MDKSRPSSHLAAGSKEIIDTEIRQRKQAYQSKDDVQLLKRRGKNMDMNEGITNQKSLSQSLESVKNEKPRSSLKRSRTKINYVYDEVQTRSNASDSNVTSQDESPFLKMLSDDLDALRSPKNKYVHRQSSKEGHVKNCFTYKIIPEKLGLEKSPLKNTGQESDLEEGELVEDAAESVKINSKKKKKHRKSNKGKNDRSHDIAAVTGGCCIAEHVAKLHLEVKNEPTLKSRCTGEGDNVGAMGMSFNSSRSIGIHHELESISAEKIDSPVIKAFVDKCMPLSLEEGEIMSPKSNGESSSSDELVLADDREMHLCAKVEKSVPFHCNSGPREPHVGKINAQSTSQFIRDFPVSNFTESAMKKMLQNVYSSNINSQPNLQTHLAGFSRPLAQSIDDFTGCHSPRRHLPSQPPPGYHATERSYGQRPSIAYQQSNLVPNVPPFVMQYQQSHSTQQRPSLVHRPASLPSGCQSHSQTNVRPGYGNFSHQTSSFSSDLSYRKTSPDISKGSQQSFRMQQPQVNNKHHQNSQHQSSKWAKHVAPSAGSAHMIPGIYPEGALTNLFFPHTTQLTNFGAAVYSYLVLFHQAIQFEIGVHAHTSSNSFYFPNFTSEVSSKLRKWDQLKQVSSSNGGMEFTLMTYNVLAQDYLEQNLYLYSRCNQKDLQWNIRGPALIAQIISHNADIVCLQEVQEDHWLHDMKDPLEKHGYLCVFKSKEGGKPDGCAILYKRDKFHKIKFVPVEFKKGGILDRDNIGIILILKPVPPRGRTVTVPKICVATTHLLFNPKRGDVKLAQVMVFLAEIDKHACIDEDVSCQGRAKGSHAPGNTSAYSGFKAGNQQSSAGTASDDPNDHKSKSKYCPIILCGDFNSEPLSDMYKFITTGYLKYERCISKLLCGQKEGQTDRWSPELGKELLPRSVDITESCQYSHVVRNRYGSASPPERNLRKNSGKVFHEMNFQSVYEHFIKDRHGHRLTEISSHHEYVSATVDYIFYSCCRKHRDSERRSKHSSSVDEPLMLLARYRLLTTRDAHKIGHLPNTVFPSDHFCLIAKFLLN